MPRIVGRIVDSGGHYLWAHGPGQSLVTTTQQVSRLSSTAPKSTGEQILFIELREEAF